MKKILLAMGQTLAQSVADRLKGPFDVLICRDAFEIVEVLGDYCPDVLVIDLMLPGMDSCSILQVIRDVGACAKIVAVSTYIGDYTAEKLEYLNVCHLSKLPCDSGHLAGRIVDIAYWEKEEENITHKIRNILTALNFRMNIESYRFTECAIALFAQDPTQALTSQLYPAVAQMCGGTVTQVEKAIRISIEGAWKSGNEKIWRLYFGTGRNGKASKPSNGDFLARMALCLNDTEEKGEIRKKIV